MNSWKALLVFTIAFSSLKAFAGAPFEAICHGRGLSGAPLTMTLQSSLSKTRNDFGPANFKIVQDYDSKVLLDLQAANQRWMRETEQGISSFGIFDKSTYRDELQTVYVQIAYDNLGLLESFRKMYAGILPEDHLIGQRVVFQVFGESFSYALTVQFTCDFVLSGSK
jgi:hypothetical protein